MKKVIISCVMVMAIAVTGVSVFARTNKTEMKKSPEAPWTITQEQQEILTEKIKVDLEEMLESGDITQEQYEQMTAKIEKNGLFDAGRRPGKGMKEKIQVPEMTDEQKAEMTEKLKDNLSAKLEAGEITQEKYDEAIAAIESGDFKGLERNKRNGKPVENISSDEQTGETDTETLKKPEGSRYNIAGNRQRKSI